MGKKIRKKQTHKGETVKKNKGEKSGRMKNAFALSIILNLVDRFTNYVYKALAEGFFGKIFTAYSREQTAFDNGAVKCYFRDMGGFVKWLHKLRLKFSEGIETSFFHGLFDKLCLAFITTSLKYFGNFLLSFSFYSIVIGFVRSFIPVFSVPDLSFFVVCGCIIILALPLVSSKQSLAKALTTGRISRLLIFEVFGYKDEMFEHPQKKSKLRANVAILSGMAAGLLTFAFHPIYLVVFAVMLALMLMIFSSPEVGVLLTILMIPFSAFFPHSTIALLVFVLISTVSYCVKLVRGKRIFRLEILDLFVIFFSAVMLMSGMITAGGKDSFYSALLSVTLILGYFLTVNLIRTEKWLERCVGALTASLTVVAFMGIFEYFLGYAPSGWTDMIYFPEIEGRAVALFENPNVLGWYLAIGFPFLAARTSGAKSAKGRLLGNISSLAVLVCAVLTFSRAAWVAIIVSTVIYLMINTKKTFKGLLGVVCIIPAIAYVMPKAVLRRFLSIGDVSDSSSYYRVYTWKGTIEAVKDYFWGGAGYGLSPYAEIYPQYAYAGIEAAEHSHSLFLQILFGMGIFGLIIFFAVIVLVAQKNFDFLKRSDNKKVITMVSAAFASFAAALIIGVFDYVWYNYRVFYMFWIVIALGCAYIRFGDSESRRSRVIEYSSAETASIEIKG